MYIDRIFECVFGNINSVCYELLFIVTSLVLWLVSRNFLSVSRKNRPPGPVGLPILGYVPFLGKEPYKTMRNLKEKYGDIIGLYLGNKYTVVLNEYKVAKEVLNNPAAMSREQSMYNLPISFGFNEASGETWKEQRRFCFSTAKDLGLGKGYWEELVTEETEVFVCKLRNLAGQPVDVAPLVSMSAATFTLSLLLGRRLTGSEDAKILRLASEYSEMSLQFLGPSTPSSTIPFVRKICEYFKLAGHGTYVEHARKFLSFLRAEIDKHKESSVLKDYHNFINIYLKKTRELVEANDSKHSFSESMLEGNLNLIFVAASDSTTHSLDWLFRLMAQHRDIQDKVYRELMSNLGKDEKARYEQRNQFPYTFAVVMEAQRFSSISPLTTTRVVTADIPINGLTIPKGSDLFVNTWALHNDTDYWDKPEVFQPERFLTSDDQGLVKQPPSFSAFSLGKRNCPGEFIAYKQILCLFSETVRNFEISIPPETELRYDVVNGLVIRLKSQLLCFKERQS